MPSGRFHLVLCRNLAFTYFDMDLQRKLLPGLAAHMEPDSYLVLGSHEELPPGSTGFRPAFPNLPMFRKSHVAGS